MCTASMPCWAAAGMGRVYLAHTIAISSGPARSRFCSPSWPRKTAITCAVSQRRPGCRQAGAPQRHYHSCRRPGSGALFFWRWNSCPAGRSRHVIIDEQRLAPLRATSLAARIADGLAEAHRAGIVHRDLKPDNVLMTLQGIPKLADFGPGEARVSRGAGELARRSVRDAAIHGPRTVPGSRGRPGQRPCMRSGFPIS